MLSACNVVLPQTALPQSSVCGGPYSDTATTFNTATAILGFLLPLVTVWLLCAELELQTKHSEKNSQSRN